MAERPPGPYVAAAMQGVEFQGFAGDCTITGRITMFGERLSDFLNGQDRFRLHHVELESLEDGHRVAVDSVSVEREDLLAIVGTGPRGAEKQRVHREESRMQLSIGPYVILGRLHVKPGLDPMRSVLQREPMIPLTTATVAYSVGGVIVVRDVSTIIVNRLQVDWIAASADEATIFPDATIRSPYALNLTKDFMGPAAL
ncbi:MAG: hypothetical protein ABIQ58_00260 [Candidatus Limnocylindrales bacterium]